MKVSNIGPYAEEIPIPFLHHSEIISNLKPFFSCSRPFGVPGVSFYENIVTRSGACSLVQLWSLLLLSNQLFLLILLLASGEDFVRSSGPGVIMRLHVVLVHAWSLIYSAKLSYAAKRSPYVENRLKVYTDLSSVRDLRNSCLGWTGIFVILGLGLTLKSLLVESLLENKTLPAVWEDYSRKQCRLDPGWLFHPSVTSTYCFVSGLATNFVWIFPDFLLLLLSLILSKFFGRLNSGIRALEPSRFSAFEIDLLREHHGVLANLVNVFDTAITLLNLINCVLNVAFIVLGGYAIFTLRQRERNSMKGFVAELGCKVIVAALKCVVGMLAASYLHFKAHEVISDIRTWPLTRDMQDFSINNGRIGVIHAFLAQLSYAATGFSLGKLVTITAKLLAFLAIGISIFFVFSRITISACATRRGSS